MGPGRALASSPRMSERPSEAPRSQTAALGNFRIDLQEEVEKHDAGLSKRRTPRRPQQGVGEVPPLCGTKRVEIDQQATHARRPGCGVVGVIVGQEGSNDRLAPPVPGWARSRSSRIRARARSSVLSTFVRVRPVICAISSYVNPEACRA